MEFGIFQGVHKDASLGVFDREAIEHYLWVAQFADTAGFDTFWATEHHNSEYGIGGVPLLQLAHIAAITLRVRLGVAVVVPALHHPLRLAEEVHWVHQLSKGRLWLGFGPGFSQYEYGAYGVPLAENQARCYEAIDFLQQVFAKRSLSFQGEFHTIGQVEVMPAPYGGTPPPLFLATSHPGSIRRAAEIDVNPLFGFRPMAELKGHIEIYQEALAARGLTDGEIREKMKLAGVLRRTVLADSVEDANTLAYISSKKQQVLSARVHQRRADVADVAAADIDSKLASLDSGALAGPASRVIEQVQEMDDLGLGHCLLAFGGRGIHPDVAKDQLRRFASDVIPACKPVLA